MAKERDYFGTEIPSSSDIFDDLYRETNRIPHVFAEPNTTPINAVDKHWLYLAIILNSALYLTAVFVAGLVTDHPAAWKMAAACFGICYLTPLVQSMGARAWIALALVAWSVVIGLAAGIALLV